ncbi:hypothetical protein QF046_002963 [Microbacterium sp. W4I4]|uniref:hypothetical protein n=1 Tax=Microbacterium sp. W4I4 TaxID=3042295 RepID=UPI00278B417A|nr:hypothetical protein [Microbacterium sp. W4I4]MDQ0615322.1 hypothetical protein [Microbacterium sp. W4I4]
MDDAAIERFQEGCVFHGGEARTGEGGLDEGGEDGDATLFHHQLMLLVRDIGASWAAVEWVESRVERAAEADDVPTGDRFRDRPPFSLRVRGDHGLVAEGHGPGDERLDDRGLAGAVGAEHENVRGE